MSTSVQWPNKQLRIGFIITLGIYSVCAAEAGALLLSKTETYPRDLDVRSLQSIMYLGQASIAPLSTLAVDSKGVCGAGRERAALLLIAHVFVSPVAGLGASKVLEAMVESYSNSASFADSWFFGFVANLMPVFGFSVLAAAALIMAGVLLCCVVLPAKKCLRDNTVHCSSSFFPEGDIDEENLTDSADDMPSLGFPVKGRFVV